MVKLTKLKIVERNRRAQQMRAIDARVEYERVRDGLRYEHVLSFQK